MGGMTNRLLQAAAALRAAEAATRPAKCQALVRSHRSPKRFPCRRYAAWTIDGERLCLAHAVKRMLAEAPITTIAPLL
jgi:hypothetical protein